MDKIRIKLSIIVTTVVLLLIFICLPITSIAQEYWTHTTQLTNQTANHVSFIDNSKLYVISGSNYDSLDNISSSNILPSNLIGPWSDRILGLYRGIYFSTLIKNQGYIFLIGGSKYPPIESLNDVYSSKLIVNDIGNFLLNNSLPKPLSLSSSFTYNNYIYTAGGTSDQYNKLSYSDKIYRAEILSNGSLGSWEDAGTLPYPVIGFGAVSWANKATILGGVKYNSQTDQEENTNEVWEANFDPDGKLTSWNKKTPLPYANQRFNYTVIRDYLVIAGGQSGIGIRYSDVYYSRFNANGSLGDFKLSNSLIPIPLCCGSLAANDNYLYLTGGVSSAQGSYQNVVLFENLENIVAEPLDPWVPSPTPMPTSIPTLTSTPTPTPIPTPFENNLQVPDIKQYDSQWGLLEYDFASRWSKYPTIARWGCAMTSSSMVLNYFGHNTNPKDLNYWLKKNNGYLSNGSLWWPAITTFSNRPGHTGQVLDYSSSDYLDELVRNKIDIENNPVIIKHLAPQHFVVATGTKNSDFYVNDPASSKNIFLSQVTQDHGAPNSLRMYEETNTDLSLIGIVVNDGLSVKLIKKSTGEDVQTVKTDEEPPFSVIDPKNYLNAINLDAYIYHDPNPDEYLIEINGAPQHYNLSLYLHLKNGLFNKYDFDGILSDNEIESYFINFHKTLVVKNRAIKINSDCQSLLNDIEEAYKLGLIKNNLFYKLLIRKVNHLCLSGCSNFRIPFIKKYCNNMIEDIVLSLLRQFNLTQPEKEILQMVSDFDNIN